MGVHTLCVPLFCVLSVSMNVYLGANWTLNEMDLIGFVNVSIHSDRRLKTRMNLHLLWQDEWQMASFIFIKFNHLQNVTQKPQIHPGMQGIEKSYQLFSYAKAGMKIENHSWLPFAITKEIRHKMRLLSFYKTANKLFWKWNFLNVNGVATRVFDNNIKSIEFSPYKLFHYLDVVVIAQKKHVLKRSKGK